MKNILKIISAVSGVLFAVSTVWLGCIYLTSFVKFIKGKYDEKMKNMYYNDYESSDVEEVG